MKNTNISVTDNKLDFSQTHEVLKPSLSFDALGTMMNDLFHQTIIQSKAQSLKELQDSFAQKQRSISEYINCYRKVGDLGSIASEHIKEVQAIVAEYEALEKHLDEKLMVFIVGNGNAGKSTLLNALVGYEIAKTDEIPSTWNIDVYTPDIPINTAEIYYSDGKIEKRSESDAKKFTENEKAKTDAGKAKYNSVKNEELRKYKTKEERDECKKYLAKKYLYKSPVTEVRWNVNSNHLLNQCMLVDTPGLNQQLNGEDALGSISDYYHKADGVLWILDGTTIAAGNTQALITELTETLKDVGGVRNNIIGVINRMDLVRTNGGEIAVKNVIEVARKEFGEYFSALIPISARDGYNGVVSGKNDLYESSGIKQLVVTIEDLFINKADNIKSDAKRQSNEKLLGDLRDIMDSYIDEINRYTAEMDSQRKKYENLINSHYEQQKKEASTFLSNYMDQVDSRAHQLIDRLGQGEGQDFIINQIYKKSAFDYDCNKLIESLNRATSQKEALWCKQCVVSEYKYITVPETTALIQQSDKISVGVSGVNNIRGFTPYKEDTILDVAVNFIGGIIFEFRKGGIIRDIVAQMKKEVDRIEKEIIDLLEKREIASVESCLKNSLFPSFATLFWRVSTEADNRAASKLIDEINAFYGGNIFEENEAKDVTIVDTIMTAIGG